MSNLLELLTRVERATEPDRELDARLECLWSGWDFERMPRDGEGSSGFFAYEKIASTAADRLVRIHDFKRYTASLDAAMVLADRLIPPSRRRAYLDAAWCTAWYRKDVMFLTALPLEICASVLRARLEIDAAIASC